MNKVFDELSISLATPEQIRSWSFGEVKKPETINYRTLKPEKDGLFDERIFGPTKDWECSCGRYKRIRYRGIKCERCGVEVTRREVRRERMGHIELAAPVTHIWYFKGVPSRLGYFLDMSPKELEKVIYFASYLVVEVKDKKRTKDLSEIEEAVVAEVEIVNEDFEEWELKRLKQMNTEVKAMENAKISEPEIQIRKKEIEKEIKQKKAKSQAEINIIEEAFATLKTLKPRQLIDNDVLWREMIDKYDDYFTGGMGAEAVRDLVLTVDLKEEMKKLQSDLESKSAQRRQRAVQRMKVIKPFHDGKNDPDSMILEVIPVIPPELRPMVQLDGGRFATSDLNDLYRRLINRNNRLRKLIELGAPEIIISNEKRMLQESVDALFDNGRRGRAVAGAGGRGLKSLSDMLKGKQGRFRQNLLGKRVDYSARSVIVVGPHLQLQQCGLPKMMALELFKPFVMKRLVELGLAQNIKSAKRMVERARAQVWDVLAEVIEEHPVLLNRAPTLHRLGIQAFEPVLVEGKAIQVHPLVCEAFNADFDGDQMAVHVPLSAEAQAEAKVLMMSTNNLLSPASGSPVVSPSQDMVIGLYYLTECFENLEEIVPVHNFVDFNEAQIAYENGIIELQTPINVRIGTLAGSSEIYDELTERFGAYFTKNSISENDRLVTTFGRMVFNSIFPKDFPYIQNTIRKFEMKLIIQEVINRYDKATVQIFLDSMKEYGFKYGTKLGLTIAMQDLKAPPSKKQIIENAEDLAENVGDLYTSGILTEKERYQKILEIWNDATDRVQFAMSAELASEKFNPVDMMVKSGARGNMMQVRQLAGMRGLVANPKGQIIERPIKSNFKEGMDVLEYFISTHGARKGLADTALRTADSGYLTRRLVDVAAGVVVKDIGDENIDWKGTSKEVIQEGRVSKFLKSSIYGRVISEDVKFQNKIVTTGSGKKLTKGVFIDDEVMNAIATSGVTEVKVLTPFNSLNPDFMDPQCYGFSLATGHPVEVGEAVGIIAAQAIGEPGTQLTMRTFHTGGAEKLDFKPVMKPVLSPLDGMIASISRTEVHIQEIDNSKGVKSINEEIKDGTKNTTVSLLDYIDLKTEKSMFEGFVELIDLSKSGSISVGDIVEKDQWLFTYPLFEVSTSSKKPESLVYEKKVPEAREARENQLKELDSEEKNVIKNSDNDINKRTKVKEDKEKIFVNYKKDILASKNPLLKEFIETRDELEEFCIKLRLGRINRELVKRGESEEKPQIVWDIQDFAKKFNNQDSKLRSYIFNIADKLTKEFNSKGLRYIERTPDGDITPYQLSSYEDYKTPKEAEKRAKELGISGSHEVPLLDKDGNIEKDKDGKDKKTYIPGNNAAEYKEALKVNSKDSESVKEFDKLKKELLDAEEAIKTATIKKNQGLQDINRKRRIVENEFSDAPVNIESNFGKQTIKGSDYGTTDWKPFKSKNTKYSKVKWIRPCGEQENKSLTGSETLQLTSGLPRVVELFEARTPKGQAVLSPITGKIKSISMSDEGNRTITIVNDKEEKEILVLRRQNLLVSLNEDVLAGQNLTTGPKDPREVLGINGIRACQEYIVQEVQKTYRDQGVEVHDKHVEMIVRQMIRRVRIVKTNDSDFLPNELVDSTFFRKTNQELVKNGKVPAEGRPELMGITKASLATDSWLSAASFQETTRVLTDAAMRKSTDSLSGLKENVIIGTLIPAGTGSDAYQSYTPSLPDVPGVSELGFMTSNTEESEEDALPNPAQWLAMLGEEKEEENE